MKDRWDPEAAASCDSDLCLRVYTSRLLGLDDTLVLHGGGNTSVKLEEQDVLGREQRILYVKGSGWDLASIESPGFAPVLLDHLVKLSTLDRLSDPEMVNELATHVTRAGSPAPSVEAILHAILPFKYVDHTHADAVIAITNTDDGERRVREIYGSDVVVVPYVMPGFDLARVCAREFQEQSHGGTLGMVLLNHGIFSFGDTAEQSYRRMIELVQRAEAYLERNDAWNLPELPEPVRDETPLRGEVALLRKELCELAGVPLIVSCHTEPRYLAFANRRDVLELSQQGPATPDHVLRTKRVPMVGRDVAAYAARYSEYFLRNQKRAKQGKVQLDPAPRVVLDPRLGLCTVGKRVKDADIVRDIYSHTLDIILRANALGGYRALPEKDIFDVEYWDLEQAKLRRGSARPMFAGEVALVTGVASGIGKACAAALLHRGAAVIGLDLDEGVKTAFCSNDFLGVTCDVTDTSAVRDALEGGVLRFGGLDMLVLNAGVFPGASKIAELSNETWRRVMAVNLDANLTLLRECHELLTLAPAGGRVVLIGSKNVAAPGPGAAAYSASKAAVTQLARVTALEWGAEGIRVNVLHPDAVFDTGIWTDEVVASRARSYGLSVQDYRRRNVLKTEVESRDVGELAAELCGPLFAKTTGLQIPIDGGNERVI